MEKLPRLKQHNRDNFNFFGIWVMIISNPKSIFKISEPSTCIFHINSLAGVLFQLSNSSKNSFGKLWIVFTQPKQKTDHFFVPISHQAPTAFPFHPLNK